MTEPETTYAITSGEYSDYRVHCIVPNRAMGDLIVAKLNRTAQYIHFRIEELQVVTDTEMIAYGPAATVIIDWEGSEVGRGETELLNMGDVQVHDEVDESAERRGRIVWASSPRGHDVALKAARDHLALLKAQGSGLV